MCRLLALCKTLAPGLLVAILLIAIVLAAVLLPVLVIAAVLLLAVRSLVCLARHVRSTTKSRALLRNSGKACCSDLGSEWSNMLDSSAQTSLLSLLHANQHAK